MQINPYLAFDGRCEEAFKFYERCLGGKIVGLFRNTDAPVQQSVPPEWAQKVMHATLHVNGAVLLGADAPPDHYKTPTGFSVSLQIAAPAEAERIFKELSAGGSIQMPIQETFWAARFAIFIDRFGIPWMINCEKPV